MGFPLPVRWGRHAGDMPPVRTVADNDTTGGVRGDFNRRRRDHGRHTAGARGSPRPGGSAQEPSASDLSLTRRFRRTWRWVWTCPDSCCIAGAVKSQRLGGCLGERPLWSAPHRVTELLCTMKPEPCVHPNPHALHERAFRASDLRTVCGSRNTTTPAEEALGVVQRWSGLESSVRRGLRAGLASQSFLGQTQVCLLHLGAFA